MCYSCTVNNKYKYPTPRFLDFFHEIQTKKFVSYQNYTRDQEQTYLLTSAADQFSKVNLVIFWKDGFVFISENKHCLKCVVNWWYCPLRGAFIMLLTKLETKNQLKFWVETQAGSQCGSVLSIFDQLLSITYISYHRSTLQSVKTVHHGHKVWSDSWWCSLRRHRC